MRRLPMRKIKEVLRLHAADRSARQIGPSVGVSRSTVADYLRRAEVAGKFMAARLGKHNQPECGIASNSSLRSAMLAASSTRKEGWQTWHIVSKDRPYAAAVRIGGRWFCFQCMFAQPGAAL